MQAMITCRNTQRRLIGGSVMLLVLGCATSTLTAGTLDNANFAATYSTAIGEDAQAAGENAIALGSSSFANGQLSISVGSTSNANSTQSTALGGQHWLINHKPLPWEVLPRCLERHRLLWVARPMWKLSRPMLWGRMRW